MRVSTALMSMFSLDSMLNQQHGLSRTQLQISTGRRILTPADDPFGSSRGLDLGETVAINEQYSLNAVFAANRLKFEEGVLQGMNTGLQRVRELAILANNDSQTAESRGSIQVEVKMILEQMLDLGNSVDSNGEYLFAGHKGKTKPFAPDGAGNFLYYGDDGQRFLAISAATDVAVGDSGKEVFQAVRNGNAKFQIQEDPANTGTGIIDPGSVIGTFLPDTYTIKFIPPTVPPNNIDDPVEYYVVDTALPFPNVIEPPVGVDEPTFLTNVGLGTMTGTQYEEGVVIGGIVNPPYGVQTSIQGDPQAGDQFIVSPSDHQDIFKTVQNFVDALDGPFSTEAEKAHFHNAMNRVIVDIDQAMGSVLDTEARVGARLHTVDKQIDINESFNLHMKETLSAITDLDYAEAITRLNMQMRGLSAAQQTYTNIQGLSLFNYI